MTRSLVVRLSAAALLCAVPVVAEPAPQVPAPPPAVFKTAPATSPIRVDGVLDEPAWRDAVVIPLPYEWQPGDNAKPPVDTDCLVTYDGSNLYVAFRAFDPDPSAIRAHLMDRDDTDTLIQDDHVGVMIDTFNDERRAFQFRVNPLGVQADAIFSEQDGVEDFSWDMIWDSVGRVTAEGYVVEIAFPLKQLRFPGGGGPQTWGFEAFRSWPRNVRHRISSRFTDRNKGCILCQENKIEGVEGLSPGRNAELDPTGTYRRTDAAPAPGEPLVREDSTGEVGVTGRWSPTTNLTINGAVNPDFSQVEADVAQLDVNERFALFYPEKRPFFLEGLDFFTTPIQAVFTRTIADPYFGAKLTNKQGANATGVFVARDRFNSLIVPGNQGSASASLDDDVTTTVARYRRDVGVGSTIGALYAGRESGDYHNRQIGVDLFFRPVPSEQFRVQYIRSDTRYPEEIVDDYGQPDGAFGGNAAWLEYQHVSRNWVWLGSYERYDRGFRSDTGFVPRVDTTNLFGLIQRRFWGGAGRWFTTVNVGLQALQSATDGWTVTDRALVPFVNYTGPYQTAVNAQVSRGETLYEGQRYTYTNPLVRFGIKPTGDVNLTASVRFGGGVDFANAREATSTFRFSPAIEYRPASRVSLALSHSLEQLSVDEGRLYQANLTQLRAVYHLNLRTFVRAILQYTDISRDPGLYIYPIESRSRRLFSQYLFSYKVNPQTVLFLGYSDNWQGARGIDLGQQNRTFFVKVGYAWIL